jgi:hypothetical protein
MTLRKRKKEMPMRLMRTLRYLVLALVAAAVLMPNRAWALNEILAQTKEEMKLQYDVSVRDLGNGRVFVFLTLADAGRLKPLRSVELEIPGRDVDKNGGVAPELHLSLATGEVDGGAGGGGKQTGFELTKELAERAEIWLTAAQLDGKQMALTGYVYRIPIAPYMKSALSATTRPIAAPAGGVGAAPPAAGAPERKN